MHHFTYRHGELHVESLPVHQLAEQYGTPLYIYSARTIRDHFSRLQEAMAPLDHEIAYAVKANSNLAILQLLKDLGAGFDIVSGGELYRVIAAGGDPRKCTFAGVGKTAEEIQYALEQQIYSFNVESLAELSAINGIAQEMGVRAPVALRVNPNVDAETHKYISTGKSENKFGIDIELIEGAYEQAGQMPGIEVRGLQMHIGSQLTKVEPFQKAVEKVAPLARRLKERHGLEFLSIGGGIGIIYEHALESGSQEWWDSQPEGMRPITAQDYAQALVPVLRSLGLKILLEPGRFVAGNAGIMVTKCLYEKLGSAKTFKIVDAAMNDLIRPALYQGHHQIIPVSQKGPTTMATVDVVGPVCETGDFFCEGRTLPNFQPGDYLALMSAGAYGSVMGSSYNSRPLPAEVLVDGHSHRLIRERQTYRDLIDQETCGLDPANAPTQAPGPGN